jgi:NADH-quinone oxidoreductase subunit L
MHHEQDMRKMGGLKKYMPITFWCYLAGMLALSGVPPFAGFWSKDEVLLVTFQRNKLAWGLATFAAFLTAFYMTRQMYMVFAGKWRGGDHHPHEVRWNMWLPIAVLSVFAVGLGFFAVKYGHYLGAHSDDHHGKYLVMGLSVLVGAAGIGLGWLVYGRKTMAHADEPDPVEVALPAMFRVLNRKWYVDEFYEATAIRFTLVTGEVWRLFDKLVIDGILHGIAWTVWGVAQVVRWVGDEFVINGGFDAGCESVRLSGKEFVKLQSGRIQGYLRMLCLGAVVLMVIWFLT